MEKKVFIIMCRQCTTQGHLNSRIVSVHETKKAALDVFNSLKYGHITNGNDVRISVTNEQRMFVTTDTCTVSYEIEIHKIV